MPAFSPLLLVLAPLLLLTMPPQPAGSAAAHDQARLCASVDSAPDASIAACRQAVELGLDPEWSAALRLLLARKLAVREQWDEVVDTYRALVEARPKDADVRRRLGAALLLGKSDAASAVEALRESVRLAPEATEGFTLLAAALGAAGRHPEAALACDEALRLDPARFELRPSAAALCEAARRGEAWPPPAPAPSPELD
jgi:tetratricopeptide (TPR) repeat protein